MTTVIIFADARDIATRVILPQLLNEISNTPNLVCKAVLLSFPGKNLVNLSFYWLNRFSRRLQILLGTGRRERALQVPLLPAKQLARRFSVPFKVMPAGDPNSTEILQLLMGKLKADIGINLYCKRLFRESLLASFKAIVNYHNGSLPRFRGTSASNWSIYQGSITSDYTFHFMDNGFDTGNVILGDSVLVNPLDTPADLELRKAEAACRNLPTLIQKVLSGYTGRPQMGIGGEHTNQAYVIATSVKDPSILSRSEWDLRLKAFLYVKTIFNDRWYKVTSVRPCAGQGRWCFCTADGIWLRVTGIEFWPTWLKGG